MDHLHPTPRLQEEYSAKIPALALLARLGWTFLPPEQALAERGGKTGEVVLRGVLRAQLRERRFVHGGREHALSGQAIDKILEEVCTPALGEGLPAANERLYNHLLYGITVTDFIDGRKVSPTVPLIRWDRPEKNSFLFTEEYTVLRGNGVNHRVPDIVCFVNGLPLAVVEAKRPDGRARKPTMAAGISQHLRNQRSDEIPLLFVYSQLLLSINGVDGRYGTQGTAEKFWALWREEEFEEAEHERLKNMPLTGPQWDALFGHRPGEAREWYRGLVDDGELAVTDQDRLLVSLLSPARLLEMTRFYTLFDKKHGRIVARHPQFFGIRRLIERIGRKNRQGAREGGVIWHTTGSGKSFTMVFLSKALILHEALKQSRIVVVTDRVDLENQLSRTFRHSGELAGRRERLAAVATSGRRLAEQIGRGTERIVFTLINKFGTAIRLPECFNDSPDMIVLVDEGHRGHGGENHQHMRRALPNAAFVAFTGTPLLKGEKTTNKFGPIVHAYTMQRAAEDRMVTPLLYEERIPDLETNDRAVDVWFDRITEGLTDKQKSDLKCRLARKKEIYQSEDRIRLIAWDIANHFVKNIDEGLKGQLACDSKLSAVKYKQYLDEAGLFESAVVMSPPDSREGNTEVDESTIPEVTRWWKENVGSREERDYTRQVVERFSEDNDLKLLIVVDKLLTGFDEPRNTVLYIDKPLKQHNLIQAIARVNRLHPKKQFGLLIDYRGILAELDTTIAKYQDLASRTQGGYDIEDIAGLYSRMSTEYKKLPGLYRDLWAIFDGVKKTDDHEQLRQVLVPRLREIDGELVDVNRKTRDAFYERLTGFATCLKVALQSATFYEDSAFTEDDRRHYKETLKQLTGLRQVVQQDAGERVDYDAYTEQVKKLMDKHVVGVEVKDPKGVYEVGRLGKQAKPEQWNENKLRNETDIIKTRVTRMIEQDLSDDPYAQEVFSKLLREAIREAEAQFDYPLKQYYLFREFEQQVEERRTPGIPEAFDDNRHAKAYYGAFKKVLPETLGGASGDEQQAWIDKAYHVDEVVRQAVAEHSVNPQNIEDEIRKNLLPSLFEACRDAGAGLDQTKAMIDLIVKIMRSGAGDD